MHESHPDTLFDRPARTVRPFEFDADVARVFPDMVRRSVPGYAELIGLGALIARRIVPPGGCCYDLGCSLGAFSRALLRQLPEDARLIAVDNAPAMIERLQAQLRTLEGGARIETRCADIETLPIENAALVVLNLTLQFIPPERRAALLGRIRAGLAPGGALILAEKIALPGESGAFLTAVHEDFKRANGYSELAIAGKRAALDRVLIPETIEAHEERLRAAGFRAVERWFQNLTFVGWVAWS
ncbi:MAG: carboxy-S-adenosyl-L-methionine synthase CmoA [Chromatiaceae bacterium]|nr:carboxy-S-adenosyl-L-methionine synthase CmoA [Chromatiaceae bacterium]